MRPGNQSSVSEFLHLGLPVPPEQQGVLFALFLGMYLTTVLGNLLIMLLIRLDSRLHTPMYFFLSHLALSDVSLSSITVPKMLTNMRSQSRSITYLGCISQVYFIIFFCSLDDFLLTVMAYDRYVAICHPLHYTTIMRDKVCNIFMVGCWLSSWAQALLHTLPVGRLMRPGNQSSMSEFLLLGLPVPPEQQGVLFALFLGMYLTTVLGNLLIILLVRLDSSLHTPMYFFLSHLALSDVSFASITVPKMLTNMQRQCRTITYSGCISQVYFFVLFGSLDSFLLAVMAYDRYVAICHPLHYTSIMRDEVCILLVVGCWLSSCAQALLHTLFVNQLSFRAGTTIPHFFCDLAVVLKSSCSDTSLNELLILTVGGLVFILPLSAILGSYIRMAVIILKVPSLKRISKALSTCGSHLSAVLLYYGTIAGVYYFPSSADSKDKDIIASVMYTVVTPMLNPFIYSLRNNDVKHALQKIFRAMGSPWCH
ncbi:olfactory receptor 1J4-like [Manis pentadactyla]|uniref:olfactory receptor 1J4-like n=1 Tax=Manis pentadactyla TaxID=143292 RepID=UPI00255C5CA8|nr:olfactory receptor 1J4-like [Manis pentadactyla]